MALYKLLQLLGKLALEAGVWVFINLRDRAVESPKVMRVINLFLVDVSIDQPSPHLLVEPLHGLHLNHQFNQQLLVVNHFSLPLVHEDFFELRVHQLREMRTGQSSVLSEGNHQLVNLLTV